MRRVFVVLILALASVALTNAGDNPPPPDPFLCPIFPAFCG